MLPSPMLARADSTLPVGDYGFEVKWDGFRAIVSTEDGFRVRSRRGWNMAPLISEIAREDVRGVFDGELVAFREGVPHFPNVTARMLHRRREIPVAFAVFDVLALDSEPTTSLPYAERRELLESLELGGGFWFLPQCSTMARLCSRLSASRGSSVWSSRLHGLLFQSRRSEMADEIHHEDDSPMHRSASSMIFQGITAVGTLAAGAAAVKATFGGGRKSQVEPPQQSEKDSE